MPNLFTGGSNSCIKHFEIRVNQDHLILRGSPDEASSVVLQGSVVLCTSEPLKVPALSLRFTGHAKLPETRHGNALNEEFYQHVFNFDEYLKPSTILPAGNLELPFSLVLPGTMYESIEGMPDSWIVYRLKATIDRGLFVKNVECRRHIRIIRTFDSSALELAHGVSMDNLWAEKIKYSISSPSKGIVFGSAAQVDFELVPLLKGLKIGKITTSVSETCRFVDPRYPITGTRLIPERETVVISKEYRMPEGAETVAIDGLEGYRVVEQLRLPRSLTKCRQSINNERWMAIRHRFNFVVELINPDGHVSEIRANLPVHIFISPNNTLSEENELQGPIQINQGELGDSNSLAPPLYGQHQLDRLYGSVDSGRFVTPFQSGRNTPYSPSRRGSDEDVTAMASTGTNEVAANTLQNRLHSLTIDRESPAASDDHRHGSDAESMTTTASTSPSGRQSPEHLESSAEDVAVDVDQEELLSRIPSYNTALRTPLQISSIADLPDYSTSATTTANNSRPATPRDSLVSLLRRHSPPSHAAASHAASRWSMPQRHVHYAAEPSRA